MSNTNSPFGLAPVMHISGAPWNGLTFRCYVPSTDNDAMYIGDPIVFAGSADTTAVAPTVKLATAGNTNPVAGVITGFERVYPAYGATPNLNLQITYKPASTAMYCYVVFDPTVIYAIQANVTTTVAATDVGSCYDLVAGSGSTSTGWSGWALNSNAKTASASTYQVRLWGAVADANNDISSVYARWLVTINLNQLFSAGVNTAGTAYAGGCGA